MVPALHRLKNGMPAATCSRCDRVNLGAMVLASRGCLSQDSVDERGDRSSRRANVSSHACRVVDMNGRKHCACSRAIVAPSRRFFLAALAAAVISPTGAHAQAGGSASSEDIRVMRMALDEARQGDFPFGAVIVRDGSVIARGHNVGPTTHDPTAHGEMVAIRRCLDDFVSSDRFSDDQTGRARQRGFFNLLPSGLPKPCVGFLLAIGLALARDDEELSRYQSCRTRLRVTRIGPQIDEQQPRTGLHTCSHLAQQFDVVRYREDVGGVCDD